MQSLPTYHHKHRWPRLAATALLMIYFLALFAGLLPPLSARADPRAQPAQQQTKLYLPLVSAARPSSEALIARAVASGKLSADTGALYTIYAAFADPRLPAEYRGDDSDADMSGAVRRAIARYPELPAATQAQIAPFLLPPPAPGSWHELREAGAQPAGASLAAASVAWRTIGQRGDPFKVWYQPRYGAADAQLAQRVYDTMLLHVWPKLVPLMGAPMSDGGQRNNGGDGAFDIYIVNSSTKVIPYAGCEATPAYLLLDRSQYSDAALATIVMHAILYRYALARPCSEYDWLNNATAIWAIDHVFPDDQTEHTKARDLLDSPGISLEILDTRYDDEDLLPGPETTSYGRYLWPFYLARVLGQPALIRAIWDGAASQSAMAAINSAVPGGFAEQWPRFAQENWNRDPAARYRTLDGLESGARPEPESGNLNLGGQSYREVKLTSEVFDQAAEYYHFTIDDPAASTLLFRNGFDDGAWPTAHVTGWVRIEGKTSWEQPEDWTDLPSKLYCRDLVRERVAEIVVIVSNSEWQNRQHQLKPANPPKLSVSNVGCAAWSGTVRYSYAQDDPAGDWIEEHVTDVVFRPVEWPAEMIDPPLGELLLRPDPTQMRARFIGWYLDDMDVPRQCTYDDSVSIPILTEASFLSIGIAEQRGYGGEGRITPRETVTLLGSCGDFTLNANLTQWWDSADTVEEAEQLVISPDGRTISGSYTKGNGGVYRWELRAAPRQ